MEFKMQLVLFPLLFSVIWAKVIDDSDLTDKEKESLLNIEYAHDDPHGRSFDSVHMSLILGSGKSRLAFAKLNYTERSAKLGVVFRRMDTNRDTYIQLSELTDYITSSMRKVDTEIAAELLKNEDINGDNLLTWREVLHHRHRLTERHISQMRHKRNDKEIQDYLAHIFEEKVQFQLADKNKDGRLDAEEFAMFSYPWRYSHMFALDVASNIKRYDANKDGLLNLQEYYELRHVQRDDPTDLDIKKRRFATLDKNKDGNLNRDELLGAYRSQKEKRTAQEAEHIMREVDRDKDGALSYDEMVNGMNTMLGATHEVESKPHEEL